MNPWNSSANRPTPTVNCTTTGCIMVSSVIYISHGCALSIRLPCTPFQVIGLRMTSVSIKSVPICISRRCGARRMLATMFASRQIWPAAPGRRLRPPNWAWYVSSYIPSFSPHLHPNPSAHVIPTPRPTIVRNKQIDWWLRATANLSLLVQINKAKLNCKRVVESTAKNFTWYCYIFISKNWS